MLTQTATVTKTGHLILVRLLAPAKRTTAANLRKSLDGYFRDWKAGEWNALFDETLAGLERDGLVTRKPLALTDAGRAQALEFLGLTELPPRTNWRKVKNNYLIPATFAGTPDSTRHQKLSNSDGLRLAILRMRYDLPEVKTMNKALDALVCKELDLDSKGELKFKAVKAKILAGLLDVVGNPELDDFKKQLPANAVGASRTGADALRSALLREWLREDAPAAPAATEVLDEPRAAAPPAPPFDLAAFAERVRAAARASETGRFGDNKVFISHVWRKLRGDDAFAGVSEADFKTRLTEANHRGLLSLSRADLVEVMNPDDVRASETPYLHTSFHFVQV
jgi:hypothetical protein